MNRNLLLPGLAVAALVSFSIGGTASPPDRTLPHFTTVGELDFPRGYETWTFVGSSFGLSYSERAPGEALHHVYLEPYAYQEFLAGRGFPDGTMLALELYSPGERVSPSRGGVFPGELLAVEIAVKDTERFSDGWAYFDFGNGPQASATAFESERCHSCHAEHGASDNVFTQFYPRLRSPES